MIPLHEHPSLRYAMHLAGHDGFADGPFLLALRDALEAFVRAPRPLNIDADPVLGEAVMGWLALRLVGVHAGAKAMSRGTVTAETSTPLLATAAPLHLRWTLAEHELPEDPGEIPRHRAEAWRVASALYAREPPAIFVSLFPGAVPPELPPGEMVLTSHGYGFRVRKVAPLRCGEIERPFLAWLVSADVRAAFLAADDTRRARFIEVLDALADFHALDPFTVIPVLSRVGDLLPADLRTRFLVRLPRALAELALLLDQAERRLSAPR